MIDPIKINPDTLYLTQEAIDRLPDDLRTAINDKMAEDEKFLVYLTSVVEKAIDKYNPEEQ